MGKGLRSANSRVALITGVGGQDGSYLADLLLQRGYEVHALVRRESMEDWGGRLQNARHLIDRVQFHVGSVDSHLTIYRLIADVRPTECYHLAASSFVSYSFDDESSVLANNFNSTHYLLSSIKELVPECRFYFAGSSEMFGNASESPQNEHTPFNPRSIYGISKLAAYHLVRTYRQNHGLFACAGILFNHESPRRGFQFVTRKITSTVAKIHLGLTDHIELGNLDARRDWGYAPDYVDAMHRVLSHDEPMDYVVATGKLHSVRDFLSKAFATVGLSYEDYVRINERYFRPDEVIALQGDFSKAEAVLGWVPQKQLDDVIAEMVMHDIELLSGNAR